MSGAYSIFPSTGTRRYLFSGSGYTLYLHTQKAGRTNPAVGPTGLIVRTVRRAEGKRFELLVRGYRTLVFKTSSFGRSDNLP